MFVKALSATDRLAVKAMNKTIAFISSIILLLVSFWLEEAGKGIFQITPYCIGILGTVAIQYLVSKKWKYRISSGFSFLILFIAAFFIGDLSFYRAYNTCIEQAEQVRIALSEFKMKNGNYPLALDDLKISLPCSRCLQGTILEYESSGSEYKILFRDWLVEHSATDKEPFLAHK